jgi:alkylated DNA nucleotide flippase Atl1
MGNAIGIQSSLGTSSEARRVGENGARTKPVEKLSVLDWYRILRAHHQWTIFQAIRFALWLSR